MKRIMWAVLLASLAATPAMSIGAKVDTTGLVAWYWFNGNAQDSSGHELDGVVYGPSACVDRQGISDGALFFDGIDDYVALPSDSVLGLYNSDFTVLCWVKGAQLDNRDPTVIGNDYGTTSSQLAFLVRSRKPLMAFVGNDMYGTTVLAESTWYHIAFRYTKSTGEQAIFVNGLLDTASTGHAPFLGKAPVLAGRWNYGTSVLGSTYFWGAMDELIFYKRPLTQAEIVKIYNEGEGSTGPELISPPDSAVLKGPDFPTHVWEKVDSSDYYRFQMSTNSNFTYLSEDFTLTDTFYTPVYAPNFSGPYWWRVIACRSVNKAYSERRMYSIVLPELITPLPGEVFSAGSSPVFMWHSVDTAQYYQLTVAGDIGLQAVRINHYLTDTTYTPLDSIEDGYYYWQVKSYPLPLVSETRQFGVNYLDGVSGEAEKMRRPAIKLADPYPNPASKFVNLSWGLPSTVDHRIGIYNLIGQKVKTVREYGQPAPQGSFRWDLKDDQGKPVGNGVYIISLQSASKYVSRKLTVIR